jgi:hypothetical protein
MRSPVVVRRLVEVPDHRFTNTTWKANATRISKPVSAARMMYVRVVTAISALSFRFACTLSARVEAIPTNPANESASGPCGRDE